MAKIVKMENLDPSINYTSFFTDDTLPVLDSVVTIGENFSSKHPRLEHIHPDMLELFFVVSGEGEYSVDHVFYKVKAGDMVICNAGVPHGEHPSLAHQLSSCCCAVKNVKLTSLPANWITEPNVRPVVNCAEHAEQVKELMFLILDFAKKNMPRICSSLCASLLMLMREILHDRHPDSTDPTETDQLANQIKDFLDQNYRTKLTLKEIGDRLHINYYYLSHIFKDKTGYSPMQYIMYRRVGEAQSMLHYTQKPIGEIAHQLGFSSHSHFSAVFTRSVGISPSEYRDSFTNKQD